jgi:nucleotide-binding universal stress UspA family protein
VAALNGAGATVARVLVGVDFSAESDAALAHAAVIARRLGASVVLAHVLPLPTDLVEDSSYDPLFRAGALSVELTEQHRTGARDLLAQAAARCRAMGIECESLLVDDNPSDGLARAADEIGAALVVIGSHGRTGFSRFLLGSVAERTVRLCRRSALVARGPAPEGSGYRRILVATDFSPHAELALDAALELARPEAEIEAVHCWQTPVLPAGLPLAPVRGQLEQHVAEAGQSLVERHAAVSQRIRFVPIEATAAEGLCARAQETGADLIAIGSHGRRGVKRWLLGSIAEVTVRHAPCSVLVARRPGEQGDLG